MSESFLAQFAGNVMYHFIQIRPLLPTYLLMISSAVFPIWVGSHATLHRPVSAKRPPRKFRKDNGRRRPEPEEETQLAAGFEMSDVVLYPLLSAAVLTGLYYLIKYLEDPQILSDALNAYISIVGLYGVASFLSDATETICSYVFPEQYFHKGRVWLVDGARRSVLPKRMSSVDEYPGIRTSPLPGVLSNTPIPETVLWWVRDWTHKPAFIIDLQFSKQKSQRICPTPAQIFNSIVAVGVTAYSHLVGRPWWLTNLLGFSFTYTAFQIMSPTTVLIGSGLLSSLFLYDIYMVFYTPMMITVASKLDIPVKLVFPRPVHEEGRSAHAMLGLGDVFIPGIMIAFALRFDLYMYYLRKQKRVVEEVSPNEAESTALTEPSVHFVKATYSRVTGTWGDRFWLGSHASKLVGGHFPKTYFQATIIGYVLGLSITMGVMQVFQHGQPALLYLVPCVLGALWGTALFRGEIGIICKYTEEADDARKIGLDSAAILTGETGSRLVKSETKSEKDNKTGAPPAPIAAEQDSKHDESTSMQSVSETNAATEKSTVETPAALDAPLLRLFNISIFLPPPAPKRSSAHVSDADSTATDEKRRFRESFVELETAGEHATGEPAGKRRKLA